LVGEFGNENHSLEMRGGGAFGCCHSGKSDEDGIDSESGVGVSRDDNVHRCLEFFIGVRADLGGHLKYSRRWSGVRAGVLLGAQGAVRRGESREGL